MDPKHHLQGSTVPQTNSLDFSTSAGAEKALKKISQLMGRAGQNVVTSEFSDKPRRAAGVTYREAFLTLASGQQVSLRVTVTGDIYQVLLNNQVKPLKEHTDTAKAVAEIAALAEKNQAAFQKAQARKAAALPKGMSTPRPKIAERLKQQSTDLDAQIAERRATVAELQAKLGTGAMTDSVPGELAKLDNFAREVLAQLARADGQALEDGDVASKQGRDTLIDLGLIDRYTPQGDNVLNDKGRACASMLDSVPAQVLVLPLASAYVAAHELAKADGAMLDSVGTEGAAGYLRVGLEIVENNFPINLEEGNLEQARHQINMAASFQAALAMLDSAGAMGDAGLQQLVEIAQADVMDEDGITSHEALATLLAGGLVEASEGLYYLSEKGRQHLNDAGYDAYGKAFAAGAE